MMGLTRRQQQVLDYLQDYIAARGTAPTFAEISDAIGFAKDSRGGVYRIIKALEERGHIRRIPYRARAIEVIRAPEPPLRPFAPPTRDQLASLSTDALSDLRWLIAGILTERGTTGARRQATTEPYRSGASA